MNDLPVHGHGRVRTDTESESAGWVRWCSRERSTSLAALDVNGRPEMAFVPDEVLVDSTDQELIRRLVGELGAQVLTPAPIPPPPNGLGPGRDVEAAAMPLPTRLRFPTPPPDSPRGAALLHDAYGHSASVTSEMAAGVLGLAAQWASEGHAIGLNVVGRSLMLPLSSATEGAGEVPGADPFLWPAYTGRARVTLAWQLVEAYRKMRSTKALVTVAALDGGFWLNGKTPGFPAGQSGSDFGPFVFQLNLLDESAGAGGANPNKCSGGYTCPWHGNGVASVAAAPVGNNLGSAGVGGTVARPVCFKSEFTVDQVFRCLQVCLAWGVDVLNMSFTKTSWELVFPSSAWNHAFQFAADNRLILVAAAGNDNEDLPDDDNPRPATRTPGTITVGALDTDDTARGDSNYGSSVDLWAPGTNLPVMPAPDTPQGSLKSGTSVAAPFVSGVVAMMRAVNSSLDTFQAKQILTSTGWRGTGRAVVGVDAFAAVLAAMGGTLPADFNERNDTPETAAALIPSGPDGALVPIGNGGFATLSDRADVDWYRFRVSEFSLFTLRNQWYPLLGPVRTTLVPDDPESRAEGDLVASYQAGGGWMQLTGPLAAGGYKIRIDGSMNLYQMTVTLTDIPILPDMFEPNNSFEQATSVRLHTPGTPFSDLGIPFAVGAGRYPLTIHSWDRDFFHIRVDRPGALPMTATASLSDSDLPLDVVLYNADRTVAKHLPGVRTKSVELPLSASCYLEISASAPTRYTLTLQYEVDQSHLPGPLQNEVVIPLPDLGDPPFVVGEPMQHFLVDLTRDRRTLNRLVFGAATGGSITAELLNSVGDVVATGAPEGDGMHESTAIETGHLDAGTYVLRLGRGGEPSQATGASLHLERLPALAARR